ncbi:hypothetical protein LTR10_022851 [Elasticomyces elasticus]|uniref:DUF726 domain-containing protein n=1 Tax=Exophiala sideris TaxID=1016849 RepID=A0ABR0JC21_9EURO|nr:hypothetical protein LTR10_022851 [Elasticomyces elasticus]KAK5031228.1 hypothetical protein LTS07_004963 [Exophiala sideris]KAK5038949.1 hypothetical protein LTR13_003980 [Exophiala sideris]KAK5060833.1 hypothetical protein LTR69_005432 [Exophiala sideris]KAK5183745.1 hypothetical protein LTR44_004027 [Eurotiomycetes sp. CCFEE 6388]
MSFLSDFGSKPRHSSPKTDSQNDQADDQSLATLLTLEQRAELSLLITSTTENMRNGLIKGFDEIPKSDPRKVPASEAEPDLSTLSLEQPGDGSQEAEAEALQQQEREAAKHEEEATVSATPKSEALKKSALEFFDKWSENVVLRVGEVVNSRDERENVQHARKPPSQSNNPQYTPNERVKAADARLAKIYPPVQTPLVNLSHLERSTILKAILLMLLSLEAYRAHSRTLILRLATSLHISAGELSKMEKDTAFGLLAAASKMDAGDSASAAQKASATARKWKVGLASVAGAALIGVTGGLAAPLVAAGVGGLLGGLGLGATAAAGYLGALASSGVLVGGLFGAYGGRMTGQMMDKYAKEIEDFAFLPVKGSVKDSEEKQHERRRLRVTIGITGWLTKEEEVTQPWRVLGDGGEPFALRWELQALQNLGNALSNFISSKAWGYIKKEIIKRTILAGLWSALMLPFGILKVAKLVDSPFGVAKLRAMKAGEVLADALIHKAQGERPVSLVGHSLGARVIYSCLLALARREAFGLVESVVLMGAPVPSDDEVWRSMRSVVTGRVINVYSENDYILAFLYRTSSVQLGIAGLQEIKGAYGVESYDMSQDVTGHLKYQNMVGKILTEVGWTDIDEEELKREQVVLRHIEAQEKQQKKEEEKEAGDDAKS